MIYYLKGKIVILKDDFIVLDVGGKGYKIFFLSSKKRKKEKVVTIFCYLQKTEKEDRLYGFEKEENLELFEKLVKISGIGPKTAFRIASSFSMEELKKGIEKEEKRVMEKIFSIGNKKGQQVIFELSRRFVKEAKKDDTFTALQNLGFSEKEIRGALEDIPAEISKEERVAQALKILGRND